MRRGLSPALLLLAACALPTASHADSLHGKNVPGGLVGRAFADRAEIFTGGEATDQAFSGYGGIVYSLGGSITKPGWLLRLYASSGQYRYGSTQSFPALNQFTAEAFRTRYLAETLSAEAMLGYQFAVRNFWLKVYAGAHFEDHRVLLASASPVREGVDPGDFALPQSDPDNAARGEAAGAKVVAESWTRLGEKTWLGVDASFSTATMGYSAFSRFGMEVSGIVAREARLTLGPELGLNGREDSTVVKSGIFVTMPWRGHHLTVSGGVSGNYEEEPGIYGSLGLFRKF